MHFEIGKAAVARNAELSDLFDQLGCRGGIAIGLASVGILLVVQDGVQADRSRSAIAVEIDKARGTSGAAFTIDSSGRILSARSVPSHDLPEPGDARNGAIFDALLAGMKHSISSDAQLTRVITRRELSDPYARISQLSNRPGASGAVINTPLGSLEIERHPDPTNLAGRDRFIVKVFHPDRTRGRVIAGKVFEFREGEQPADCADQRELQLLLTLAEVRTSLDRVH